jgi:glycosyltransferase involved in cell wall biosynthesis
VSGMGGVRIGIDLRLHAYAPGGISYYARRLASAMAEQGAASDLTLVSHRRDRDPLLIAGARSRTVWTPPHHRLEQWALGAEIAPLNLDIFHSTDFIPPAWGARRMVATIHDLNFLHYPEYLDAEARTYYNAQIHWAVRRADALIVDSEATRQDLATLLGVAPERSQVVHLAADEQFRPLTPDQVMPHLARHGLSPGYLLFVGVWDPRKNLSGLLKALSLWREMEDVPRLVVAGRPGWLSGEIHSQVASLGLEPYVRFLERPTTDELVALYNGALLLVIPSFYEGFGLPALEAMQCGTPVVSSNRASLPEVVGEGGILIDPESPEMIADACRRIAGDSALRQFLREAGLRQARRFSWAKTAEQTREVYRAALAREA